MKKLFLFLILSTLTFAQNNLLLLMGDSAPRLTVLTNMEVWYKGDYGLTSSGWLDASGNSKNLLFNTTAWTPTLTGNKNGIPTALFDGTNDRTDSVLFTTTTWTVYVVIKPITHTNYEAFLDGGAYQRNAIRQGASDGVVQSFNSSQVQAYAQSCPAGTWYILMQQFHAADLRMYNKVNGNAIAGGTGIGNADMAGFKLGGWFNNTTFANFEIAEIIIYDAEHSSTTATNIMDYLNAKYKVY